MVAGGPADRILEDEKALDGDVLTPANKAIVDRVTGSPVVLAQAPSAGRPPKKASAKKGAKKKKRRNLHNIVTSNVFMHIYFPKIAENYTVQNYFEYLIGQNPNNTNPNKYQLAGVDIRLVNDPGTAVADFKSSLKTDGAVIVYLGHSVLGKKTTLGLSPTGGNTPAITSAELSKLVNKTKAKIIVLAACASDGCIRKLKGDAVVIATHSGPDRITNSLQWAHALKDFMDELIDMGSAGDALNAANAVFEKISSTDKFVCLNGDLTLSLIS